MSEGKLSERVSTYTIVCPLDDERFSILIHGVTGALDKVDRSVGDWLLKHHGCVVNPASPTSPTLLIDRLRERGYLTTDSAAIERAAFLKVSEELHRLDLMRKVPSFSFVPTYRCNLRCTYCFQPHKMHAGVGEFGLVMSPEQIDHAFDIVDEYWKPGSLARAAGLLPTNEPPETEDKWSTSEIGLFGGEPLMAGTLEVVSRISRRAAERGHSLWGISNGVELQHFRQLLGVGPGKIAELQITVDGMPHRHNRRRLGPQLRNTFDLIMENIELALQLGTQINIRMNTDQANEEDVASLASLFEDRGWSRHERFEFYCAVVTKKNGPPELDHHALVSRTLEHAKAGLKVSSYEQVAQRLLQNLIKSGSKYPFSGTAHCAAESAQVMFDARGDVYTCWEDVGDAEHRMGTYGKSGLELEQSVVEMWLQRHPGAIQQCSECPYALIHTSGCGSQAREHSGTIYASECESFQQYFPVSFADAYSNLERVLLDSEAPSTSRLKVLSA